MRNIIILGATGYLGSKLVTSLVKTDNILCIIRKTSNMKRLDNIVDKKRFAYVNVESPLLSEVIEEFKPNIVINTACTYEHKDATPSDLINSNYLFPLKILEIIAKLNIDKWINTNTAFDREFNRYTMTKHQFSDWGKYYVKHNDITFIDIYLEMFYGPNDNKERFISYIYNKLSADEPIDLTDGTQHRDLIYIDDVINSYKAIISSELQGYNIVPVGRGEAPRLRAVVEYLKEILHSNSKLNFGVIPKRIDEIEYSVANLSMMKQIGYEPEVSWQEGLHKLLDERE